MKKFINSETGIDLLGYMVKQAFEDVIADVAKDMAELEFRNHQFAAEDIKSDFIDIAAESYCRLYTAQSKTLFEKTLNIFNTKRVGDLIKTRLRELDIRKKDFVKVHADFPSGDVVQNLIDDIAELIRIEFPALDKTGPMYKETNLQYFEDIRELCGAHKIEMDQKFLYYLGR